MTKIKKKRLLAVSSGGGHWVQLQRMSKAFEGCEVSWMTVRKGYRVDLEDQTDRFFVIPDATRWNKIGLIILLVRVMVVIARVRPHAIVTTGAAPGLLALMVGRILGCRTCWIDSIANMEEMSLSGKKAKRWSTLWLTQWSHLSSTEGPEYHGSVLQNFCADETSKQEERGR
jgi:UDP-N-acetylglucosamine:LPS N-acetylglucosamine transferase